MGFLTVAKLAGGLLFRRKKSGEGPDKADRILNSTIEFIDDRKFTDEEKAKQRIKVIDTTLEFVKQSKGENSERSKARREIAKDVIKVWLSMLLMCIAVYGADKEYAEFIYKVALTLGNAVIAIIIFYFGYYGLQKVAGMFPDKKKKEEEK